MSGPPERFDYVSASSPAATPPPSRSWLSRHWKAALGLGCLTLIILFVAFVVGIGTIVISSFRSSDVYRMALERVRVHPEVVRKLGTPIEAGWFVSGKLTVVDGSGEADLSFPIHGPLGNGKIQLSARKRENRWIFRRLVVLPDDGPPIVIEESDQPDDRPAPQPRDF